MRNKESKLYASKLLSKFEIRDVLDLGAGKNPHNEIRTKLRVKQYLVDLVANPNTTSETVWIRANVLNNELIQKQLFLADEDHDRKIDCVVALHCIEHLSREDGLKLIDMMEKFSKKLTLIETPNGFVHQPPTEDNPWQEHLSGWTASDFRQRGYKVRGISGMKFLKKNSDKGAYRWNIPGIRFLDFFLSRILNLNFFPSLSFNILAWKTHSYD